MRLGARPREMDHGCPRITAASLLGLSGGVGALPSEAAAVLSDRVQENHDSERGFSQPRPQRRAAFRALGTFSHRGRSGFKAFIVASTVRIRLNNLIISSLSTEKARKNSWEKN